MQNQKPEARLNPLVPGNPEVPLTLEGSSVLHQMMSFRWADWKTLTDAEHHAVAQEAAAAWRELEGGRSAIYSLLGHKGDLLFVHFREAFDELNAAELRLAGLALNDFLEPSTSYVSMVELGLYESSVRLFESLAERGVQPGSEDWVREVEETLERQANAMAPRLHPEIPPHRYICFYPMDRKRGEVHNWYTVPIKQRQRMMHEHGLAGRKYAGTVKQIISGSIGFDDWEWGVDLFADDPLAFKKLIYEMRFDEVSSVYALFGPFYIGVRLPADQLPAWLSGHAPQVAPESASG